PFTDGVPRARGRPCAEDYLLLQGCPGRCAWRERRSDQPDKCLHDTLVDQERPPSLVLSGSSPGRGAGCQLHRYGGLLRSIRKRGTDCRSAVSLPCRLKHCHQGRLEPRKAVEGSLKDCG